MATYRWELRHTDRPFGPMEKLDAEDFQYVVSRHTTLSAARKAEREAEAEMRRYCGQNAWNDHFHVFPLRPTPMKTEIRCVNCDELLEVRRWTWEPMTFEPIFIVTLCDKCREREEREIQEELATLANG